MSKELMRRCDVCEEIKFGFAGFEIKHDEDDEWVWICDTKECWKAWYTRYYGDVEEVKSGNGKTDKKHS
tara:strand:- start:1781 stop:1987 length:207 start_codon:yes stop_codon:yes gene_type:complete